MSKKLYKIVSVVVSILFTVNSISFAVPDISQSMQKEPALRAPSAGLERTPGALISSLSALPGIPGRQTGRTVAQTALGSLPKASSAGLIDIGDFAEVRPVELISELIERTANISGSARTQLMELQQELSVLKKLSLKAFNELIRKHHVKGEWSLIVPAIGAFLFEGTGLFLFAADLRHYDARSAIIYDLIAISAEKEPVYHAVDIELRSEAVFAAIIAEADASRLLDLYSIDAYKQQIDEEAEGLAIELEVAGNRKVSICARSDIYVAALAQNEPKLNEELAKVKQDVFLNKHLGPGETEAVVRNLQLTELRRDSFVYMGVWDTDRDSSIERRYLFRIRTEFGGREFIFSSGALISSPEQLRAINETLSALQVNTIGVVMPAKESSAGQAVKRPELIPVDVAEGGNSSGLIRYDEKARRILGPDADVRDTLRLDLVSVTTDQPEYWPDETVYLKAVFLGRPEAEVEVNLKKKEGSPVSFLGRRKLYKEGLLHLPIMEGEKQRLALGEYTVEVRTIDGSAIAESKFSVVEGALGALSFASIESNFVSAEAGERWGHVLKVKAKLLHNGLPYAGEVTLQARCYLPQCDGTTYGMPPVKVDVKDGEIEATLDTSNHSGPFEIEVITKEAGSIRHMFEASGHVEREMATLSKGLKYTYRAGLSPYEGTTQVPNRQIWVEKDKKVTDDPIALENCYGDSHGLVNLKVEKEVEGVRVFVWTPKPDGSFEPKELPGIAASLGIGKTVTVPVEGPYSLITVAGFEKGEDKPFVGQGIVFAQPAIEVELDVAKTAVPMSEINVGIKTRDLFTNRGIPVGGILEVYDTRVVSRDPNRPLNAKLGDSFRQASDSLGELRDNTGLKGMTALADVDEFGSLKFMSSFRLSRMRTSVGTGTIGGAGEFEQPGEEVDKEPMREGVKKVVYSRMIETDENGLADIALNLGPQIGRYKVRFTAVKRLEAVSKTKQVDASKPASVEVALLNLLVKGARITAKAIVNNATGGPLTLRISGPAMAKTEEFPISEKQEVVEFNLEGERTGNLLLEVTDSTGKVIDRRQVEVKDLARQPVTFSNIIIPEGPVHILPGETATVYPNAGAMLKGIIANIQTTIYSWFGHGEAITAALAVKAVIIKAIDAGILDDEGQRHNLILDIKIGVQDLEKRFFKKDEGLFVPYPGMKQANPLWSAWMVRNLSTVLRALKATDSAKGELSDTIATAKQMVESVNSSLEKRGLSLPELAGYDPKKDNRDVITIKAAGIEHKVFIDSAVIKWVVDEFYTKLDLEEKDFAKFLQKAYDLIVRYAGTYERIGALPFLIQTAKSLWFAGVKERGKFHKLFSQIAKGFILSQEPGLIQGPAMLGGIYSNPQAAIRFLELLIMMAEEEKSLRSGEGEKIKITDDKGTAEEKLTAGGVQIKVADNERPKTIEAPPYTVVQVTRSRVVDIEEYMKPGSPFKVNYSQRVLAMGEEAVMRIELPEGKDPLEYYAIVALPSTLSLKQTEDILLDHKGAILYGQRAIGAQKIQMVSVPFRGSRTIELLVEGAQTGTSPGKVLIRHVNNADDITAVTTEEVQVMQKQQLRSSSAGERSSPLPAGWRPDAGWEDDLVERVVKEFVAVAGYPSSVGNLSSLTINTAAKASSLVVKELEAKGETSYNVHDSEFERLLREKTVEIAAEFCEKALPGIIDKICIELIKQDVTSPILTMVALGTEYGRYNQAILEQLGQLAIYKLDAGEGPWAWHIVNMLIERLPASDQALAERQAALKSSSAGEASPIDTVVIDESIFPESKKVADTFRKGRAGLKKLEYVLGCKVKLLSECEPGQDENLTRIIITDKVLMPFSKAVFCIIKDKKLLEGPYHLQPAILAVITAEEHIYKDNQQYEAALERATQTYGEAFKKAVYDILVSHYETDFIRPDRDILLKSRDYPADCLPPYFWPRPSSAGEIEIDNMRLKVEEPGYPFEKLRQLLARQRPGAKAPVALMSQNKIRSYLSGFSALSELSDIDLTSLVALNNPANKKQRLIIFWARPKEAGGKLCPNMLIGAEVGEEGYGFLSKKVTDISTWYPDRLGIRAGTPTFGAWSKALMERDRMMKAAGQKASSAGINIDTFANVRPVTKIEHLLVGGPEIKMTAEGKRQLELLRQELARLDKITLEDFNALITKRREDFSQIVPAIGAFTYGEKKLILFAADISYIDTGEEKIIHDGSEPYYDLVAISADKKPGYYAVDMALKSESVYEAVISQAIAQAPERIRSQSGFISAYTGLLSEIARKLVITLDLEDGSGVNILPRSDIHTKLIRRNDPDLWYELNQVSSICFNNRYEDPRAIENTVKYGHLAFERLNESSYRYIGELRERPEDKTEGRLRHLFSIEEKAANGRATGRIFIFSSGAPIPSPSQLTAIGETAPEPYRNRIALAKTLKASSAGDESDQQLPGQELMDKVTVLEDLLINRLATPEKAATLTEEVIRQYRQGVADILMKVTQAGAEGKISRDLQQEIEAKLRIQHRLIHLADLFGHIIKQAVTGDIILDTESIIKDSAQRELIENIFSNEVIKGALEGALSKKTQETSEPTARVLLLKDLAKYRDNITSEKPVIIISNDAEKLDLFNNAKLLNPGENISALAVPYQIGLAATLLTLDQQANKAPLIAKLESLSWQLRRIPLDTTLIEKLKSGEWDIFNFIITTLPTVEAADLKETDRRIRAAVATLIAA